MKHIVLTGGGTAGHVTPNLALLPRLREEGWKITYIGSKHGMEKELVEAAGVEYLGISTGKLRRYLSAENIADAFRVVKGLGEAIRLLKKCKPDVIFSKGGFVAVPVVLAAKVCKIPVVAHESDLTPGLANRITMPIAVSICTAFEKTAEQMPDGKGVYTGTPIRSALFAGKREKGLELCHFDGKKPVVLLMGGSSGALKLNVALRDALDEITKDFSVIHLCGKGNLEENLVGRADYSQWEYVSEELPDLLAAADVVISRAGSNAINEFLALRKPQLLIPLSTNASRGDQVLNAAYFAEKHYAMVLPQEELTPERLCADLHTLYNQREEMIAAMAQSKGKNGVEGVLEQIHQAIR